MAPSPYKADATFLGVHLTTHAKNLFTNEKALNMILSGGFRKFAGFTDLSASRTVVFGNLQGPSLLLSVKPKLTLAFAWNMRFIWSSRLSQPQLAKLFDKESPTLDLDGSGETALVLFNSWTEFALGAGGQIWQNGYHSVSVGGFTKLVFGAGNLNFDLDNVEVQTSGNTVEHLSFRMKALMSEQIYNVVDEGNLKLFDRTGFGFDLGAEYKFQNPRSCPGANNFRLKAGFSLTDIGQVRYKSALEYTNIDVSGDNISLDRFRGTTSFRGLMDTIKEIFDFDTSTTTTYNITLPMSLRLYGDFNFGKSLYVFTELHFLFAKLMYPNLERGLIFRYNLTPRFEDERYGVYLPMTFTNFIPANVGLALRWKPFIIGSANLFTFWAYKDQGKMFDIYLTIKIPILKKEERIDHSRKK